MNSENHTGTSSNESSSRGDFQRSVDRLERAVQGFVSAANDQVSNRAAGFIDDTAQRLERELRERSQSRARSDAEDSRDEKRRSRRHRRRHYRDRSRMSASSPGYRTSKIYLDKRHQKIAGVCAGIARYFGVEIWVVRGIAITGLIFMASIVIPAYIIAAIVLPKAPDTDAIADAGTPTERAADHTSPAPELGPRLSPRGSLRNVQADLDQLELKLRRMESHVTSGQFELQRELKRIDV